VDRLKPEGVTGPRRGPVARASRGRALTAGAILAVAVLLALAGFAGASIDDEADLSIAMTASPPTVLAGQTSTFSLTVTNDGPSAATDVVVEDPLDARLQLVAAEWPGGACTGTVSCALGTIEPGGSVTVSVEVVAAAAGPAGTLVNTATVAAATPDPDVTDNEAAASLTIVRAADLSLAQTITPDAPVAGAPVTYTLTALNDGPGPATGVEVTDPLPAELIVTDIHSAPAASLCEIAGGVLRCRFDGLDSGATATVTIVGALPRDATGTLANTASVGAEEEDPDPGDNAATVERPIGPPAPEPADLSVVKTGPATAAAGGGLSWGIDVANAGPGPATGVVVTDVLPAGTTFVRATPSQGTCAEAGGTVTCELGTLGSGSTAQITLAVSLAATAAGATVTNRATVAATTPDPQPADNRSDATTQVVAAAPSPVQRDVAERRQDAGRVARPLRGNLRLRTTASRSRARPGQLVRYTLRVRNRANVRARALTLCDRLPARVTFVRARGGRFRAGRVCWTRPRLRRGRTWTVTLVARVDPDARGGSIRNVARVRAANLAARRDGARTRVAGEPRG
jgi:uncharacterized repeat protein (TIGR01451 family)